MTSKDKKTLRDADIVLGEIDYRMPKIEAEVAETWTAYQVAIERHAEAWAANGKRFDDIIERLEKIVAEKARTQTLKQN